MKKRAVWKTGKPLTLVFVFFLVVMFPAPARSEEGKTYRVSQILDRVVKNHKGEELGDVDDLVVLRRGMVKRAVLSVGGFLGIGDRLVAVPFKSLEMTKGGGLIYQVTRDQLEKHPSFNYFEEGLGGWFYQSYSPSPYPSPRWGHPADYPSRFPGYDYPYGRFHGMYPYRYPYGQYWEWFHFPEAMRASVLLGRSVVTERGNPVGEIKDLLVSPTGKVEKSVLAVGGFLGIGEKDVAVFFQPLKTTELGVVYEVTRKELESLPSFKKP